MKKVENDLEILEKFGPFKGKIIIDVGCGPGGTVRTLTALGARVIGIDTPGMVSRARKETAAGKETYLAGSGANLFLPDNLADLVLFFASLHHIPEGLAGQALSEARRILKPGGTLVCLEPLGQKGSYFEIIKLVMDEREMQARAYAAIRHAASTGLKMVDEYMLYLERSLDDYKKLLDTGGQSHARRRECLEAAEKITGKLSREAQVNPQDFRYKSICRVNILKKPLTG